MKEQKMCGIISKGLWGAAFIAAVTSAAMADGAQNASFQVQGSAPKICSIGSWTTQGSSGGTLSGDVSPVVTFSNSAMVAADGTPKQPGFRLHTPIMCNTALTLTLKNDKGAFINEEAGTAPAGFSNKYGYTIISGTVDPSGTYINSGWSWSNVNAGQHINQVRNVPLSDAANSTYIQIVFDVYNNPPVNWKMMAGSYSEGFTLTVSPAL
jgi:hypothetical protein